MISQTYSDREIRDDLKIKLQKLEAEENKLKTEIEHIETEKRKILNQLAEHSSESYEESMLQLVYEQRHKDKK